MTSLLDLRHTWSAEDRVEQQIRAVPFEVPHGVGALQIELQQPGDPRVVLDLGLEAPTGYVGWSGSARTSVIVSDGWSTPGYCPVPTEAGTWHVLIGLHRVPGGGAPMHLVVRSVGKTAVDQDRAAQPTGFGDFGPPRPRRDLPGAGDLQWRAGDFHAHSVHSDGVLSIRQLAHLAVSRGLDFLAVTDHNTISHHRHLAAEGAAAGIHLIPGQELTRDTGHANAFGDIGFVDFREPSSRWVDAVSDRGGLLSVCHPLAADCAWLQTLPRPTPLAEVWHSSWARVPHWGAPLSWWQAWGPQTVPLGGSDFHHPGADGLPGAPTTWVLCEDDDVLGAVAAGRCAVSRDRDGALLLRHDDDVLAVDADGLLLTGFDRGRRIVRGDRARFTLPPGPTWLEDEQRVVHALCG